MPLAVRRWPQPSLAYRSPSAYHALILSLQRPTVRCKYTGRLSWWSVRRFLDFPLGITALFWYELSPAKLANETGGFETIEKLGWAPGLNNFSGFPERESLCNSSRVTRMRRFNEHGLIRRRSIGFSLEWLKWAMLL